MVRSFRNCFPNFLKERPPAGGPYSFAGFPGSFESSLRGLLTILPSLTIFRLAFFMRGSVIGLCLLQAVFLWASNESRCQSHRNGRCNQSESFHDSLMVLDSVDIRTMAPAGVKKKMKDAVAPKK
jgi:hypothetical protein